MKICIPVEKDNGGESKIYGHFGSAPHFIVYDTDKKTYETVENKNEHHVHGTCQPSSVLTENKIDAVICGGIGIRALQKLNSSGIKVYRCDFSTVEDVIKQLNANKMVEITTETACSQHRCH